MLTTLWYKKKKLSQLYLGTNMTVESISKAKIIQLSRREESAVKPEGSKMVETSSEVL